MDTNSMFAFFDMISLAAGVYVLYVWYRLQAVRRLFENSLLIPRDFRIKDCADPDGYIRYLKPRLLILGLYLALYGIVAMLNNSLQFYNNTVSMVLNGVALAVIIWYAVCSSKAVKRYW